MLRVATQALHRAPLHYTEGAERWDAVDRPLTWKEADCSSFFISIYKGARLPDPAGQHFTGVMEYTGTLSNHGRRVRRPKVGDAALYGSRPEHSHVAFVAKVVGDKVWVISHGQEGGPFYELHDYRGDFDEFRRYTFPVALLPYYVVRGFGIVVWKGARGQRLPGWVRQMVKSVRGLTLKRRR